MCSDKSAAGYRDVLPQDVKPSNYDISFYDIDFNGKSFGYNGTVVISADIVKPTSTVVLNTHQLDVKNAIFKASDKEYKATDITYDAPKQRVSLKFAEELPASKSSSLTIEFSGTINNDMAGFYRSKYKPIVPASASVPRDDEFHYMYSTQFESSDARRAFPCFDEPNLKVTTLP